MNGSHTEDRTIRLGVPLLPGLLLALILAAFPASAQTPSPFQSLLVAGSDDLPVFDNAVSAMRAALLAHQNAPADLHRLSALPGSIKDEKVPRATLKSVLGAIAALHPRDGQACFVFITSHGAHHLGLYLAPRDEFLTPAALNRALAKGCGNAPTVVIASGCYSGGFARAPMARPNRIILTAARPDRPSFGCGAGFIYTVYDQCLLGALDKAETWRDADARTRMCVAQAERALGFEASGPQAAFGAGVADMKTFGAR